MEVCVCDDVGILRCGVGFVIGMVGDGVMLGFNNGYFCLLCGGGCG